MEGESPGIEKWKLAVISVWVILMTLTFDKITQGGKKHHTQEKLPEEVPQRRGKLKKNVEMLTKQLDSYEENQQLWRQSQKPRELKQVI